MQVNVSVAAVSRLRLRISGRFARGSRQAACARDRGTFDQAFIVRHRTRSENRICYGDCSEAEDSNGRCRGEKRRSLLLERTESLETFAKVPRSRTLFASRKRQRQIQIQRERERETESRRFVTRRFANFATLRTSTSQFLRVLWYSTARVQTLESRIAISATGTKKKKKRKRTNDE